MALKQTLWLTEPSTIIMNHGSADGIIPNLIIYQYSLWVYSDSRKPVKVNAGYSRAKQPDTDQRYQNGEIYVNFRIGRHLQLNYDT